MTNTYASSITVSALLLSPIHARVKTATFQVLGVGGPAHTRLLSAAVFGRSGAAHAGLLSAQILGFSGGARVTQIYLHAIVRRRMPPPTYPTLAVGFSVIKRPKFSTGRAISASGRDVRVGYWAFPLWEWELTYEYLPDEPANGYTPSDLKTLLGFFLSVSGGLSGFLFDDPDDDTVTSQVLGTTDGVSIQWRLMRSFGGSDGSGIEPIGWLDQTRPFHVYLDGVLQDPSSYSLSQSPVSQLLRFNSVPPEGQVITADMSYFYYVRFKDDTNDFEKFMHRLWSVQKVTLESLRG